MEMEQGLSHICKYAESIIVQVVTFSLRHGKYEFHIDVQLYLPTCLPAWAVHVGHSLQVVHRMTA
jgi:hypothetical protein